MMMIKMIMMIMMMIMMTMMVDVVVMQRMMVMMVVDVVTQGKINSINRKWIYFADTDSPDTFQEPKVASKCAERGFFPKLNGIMFSHFHFHTFTFPKCAERRSFPR